MYILRNKSSRTPKLYDHERTQTVDVSSMLAEASSSLMFAKLLFDAIDIERTGTHYHNYYYDIKACDKQSLYFICLL